MDNKSILMSILLVSMVFASVTQYQTITINLNETYASALTGTSILLKILSFDKVIQASDVNTSTKLWLSGNSSWVKTNITSDDIPTGLTAPVCLYGDTSTASVNIMPDDTTTTVCEFHVVFPDGQDNILSQYGVALSLASLNSTECVYEYVVMKTVNGSDCSGKLKWKI